MQDIINDNGTFLSSEVHFKLNGSFSDDAKGAVFTVLRSVTSPGYISIFNEVGSVNETVVSRSTVKKCPNDFQ